ncbi:hypothetical protein BJ508DRAFT_419098 [Ascobolus immersus RN42]|uniref:DUF7580 domain-containing protein n=1 Tax=Ascobolus immersus RN42 TaxID=1160509 RepID=A0A3N4HIY1_ASCIM|nr:hypothetical protein BJ508DRAFT_419098 [Ascobolus immersus RN42]
MEPAGLALGALAVVGSTISAYRTCSAIFQRPQCHIRELKRYADILYTEEEIFVMECTKILAFIPTLNQELAAEMIADPDHSLWSDEEVKDSWEKHCKPYGRPIQMSLDTLLKMKKKMDGVWERIKEDSESSKNSGRFKLCKSKTFWRFGGKEEMDQLVESITRENVRLTRLREQHQSLDAPRKELDKPKIILPDPKFRKLSKISDISKALYDGMASAVKCPCHLVHLQLQDIFDSDPQPITRNATSGSAIGLTSSYNDNIDGTRFRMVISHEDEKKNDCVSDLTDCNCTSILVTSEFYSVEEANKRMGISTGKRKAPGSPTGSKRVRFRSPSPVPGKTPSFTEKRTEILLESACNKSGSSERVTVALGITSNGRKRAHDTIDVPPGKRLRVSLEDIEDPEPTVSRQSSADLSSIDDICSLMSKLESGSAPSKCLGYISSNPTSSSSNTSLVYRHSVYRDIPSEPLRAARTSLASILDPASGKQIYPSEMYNMAHLLTRSLICLGSTPNTWFIDGWGSREINFFLDGQVRKSGQQLNTLKPFIMPRFPTQTGSHPTVPSKSQCLARDSQLFSLAVVLIELAFGRPLAAISVPGVEYSESSEDADACYRHAKAILDHQLVKAAVGSTYADIVERCFYGDFGLRSREIGFANEKMREVFYTLVVMQFEKELERFI